VRGLGISVPAAAAIHEIFGDAEKADRQTRLRSLKDLDAVALTPAEAFTFLLDPSVADNKLRCHGSTLA
jgi:hypothetical protein